MTIAGESARTRMAIEGLAGHNGPDMVEVGAPSRPKAEDWEALWTVRAALLRVARRRLICPDDAEDVVTEAMLRATDRGIEPTAAGAWLTRVVINICIDRHRREHSRRRAEARLHTDVDTVPSPEDDVCDRDEAAFLSERLRELPPRQQRALLLKAAGLGSAEIATRMDTSYKTVESLLARARATLRSSLLALIGWIGLQGRLLRRFVHPTPLVAAACGFALLTTAVFALGPNRHLPVRSRDPFVGAGPAPASTAVAATLSKTGPAARALRSRAAGRPAELAPTVLMPANKFDVGRAHAHTGRSSRSTRMNRFSRRSNTAFATGSSSPPRTSAAAPGSDLAVGIAAENSRRRNNVRRA